MNVTARRNRDFHEEVLRLKAAADGVELLSLPEKSKAQASLSTLFDKQTSKQTSTSPRPVPSVGGSVAMTTRSSLGGTVSSIPVSSVGCRFYAPIVRWGERLFKGRIFHCERLFKDRTVHWNQILLRHGSIKFGIEGSDVPDVEIWHCKR